MTAGNMGLIFTATLSAFLGAFLGSRVLRKVTIATVRVLVGCMLLGLAAALCLGVTQYCVREIRSYGYEA